MVSSVDEGTVITSMFHSMVIRAVISEGTDAVAVMPADRATAAEPAYEPEAFPVIPAEMTREVLAV